VDKEKRRIEILKKNLDLCSFATEKARDLDCRNSVDVYSMSIIPHGIGRKIGAADGLRPARWKAGRSHRGGPYKNIIDSA